MNIGQSSITDNPHINYARGLLRNSPGYSQQYRYSNGRWYDCSSFIQAAYGIPENITTAIMPKVMPKYGYTYMAGLEGIRPGDILWRNGHTEIYTGDGYTLGAHSTKNGVSEYKYKGNLDQYAGYFRPPDEPFSAPSQNPVQFSGSRPLSNGLPSTQAELTGNDSRTVPMNMNPSLNVWNMYGKFINSLPYVSDMQKQYMNLASRFMNWG